MHEGPHRRGGAGRVRRPGAPAACAACRAPTRRAGAALLALAATLAATGAHAQLAGQPVTGNLVPQGSPLPRILPEAPPVVPPSIRSPEAASPSRVPARDVAIRRVAVEGSTAYSRARIDALLRGLAGPAVPLARIEAARVALLDLYRQDGFVLTTVSAAVEPGGLLRFDVVEGRIAEVRLEGDIGPAGTLVLRFLRHLTRERPVSAAALERWLLLAQDIPGVSVNAVLRPSGLEPGALTLVAQVSRHPVDALATADNRAFRLTGPVEYLAVADYNSISALGERTELSLYHTDGNTQTFGQASTTAFVGGSGLSVRVFAGYGQSAPSGFLRDLRYAGATTTFGLSASYPLIRTREQNLSVSGFLDAEETQVSSLGAADPAQGLLRNQDDLRIARIGASYALQDGLAGVERPAANDATIRLSQGLPFLGTTRNGAPSAQRPGERTDFTKATLDLQRVQTLFRPWRSATLALRARVLGQLTADPLPPAEQFFLGGPDYDRGFYSGEASGDNALAWTLELDLNTGFEARLFGWPLAVATQLYAFYDRGETWQEKPTQPNERLSSEGIGARFTLTRFTEFDIEGDIRNTRVPSGAASTVSPLKSDAAYWRVLARF